MAVLVPCNKPDEAPFCYGAGAGSSLVGTYFTRSVFFVCHSHCATGRTFNPPGLSKSRILFTRVGAGADNKNTARRSCSASALPTCAMAVRPEANAARWPPRQLHRHGRAAARLRQPSCSPRSSTQASRRGCAAASTRAAGRRSRSCCLLRARRRAPQNCSTSRRAHLLRVGVPESARAGRC